MMIKIGGFLEEHIEKIILGVVGVVCLLLLFFRVLVSPNYVEYEGKKFSASEIDVYINEQVQDLRRKLDQPPKQSDPYESQSHKFTALFESAISDIDVSISPPMPPHILRDVRMDNRTYRIPHIGEVNDVAIEYIRAVAYVPTEEINEQVDYERAAKEPNDIDLVTVEGKFDVAGLYESFNESFAGVNVREEWRDPCLAQPVFGAVQLQRQEQLEDGSWSDWQIVPRTKIDARRQIYEVIEDVVALPPGGIKVRIFQFADMGAVKDLLQPGAYGIASANEEWFPPSLHKKFLEQRRAEELEEKRGAMEDAEREREREREERLQERRSRRPDARQGGYGEDVIGGSSRSGRDTRTRGTTSSRSSDRRTTTSRGRLTDRGTDRGRLTGTRDRSSRDSSDRVRTATATSSREVPKRPSISDIYSEFDGILLASKADVAKMREPLVFWAHDDTVEPMKKYRYRIRVGVFNPVAGVAQLSEGDKMWKNNVILWSEFSDVTETVDIPGRMYFFANDIQEAAKIVTVSVCKYVLGYWYSERFAVKQGEVIGGVKNVELKPEEQEKGITVPAAIDYGTGAVLVDVVPVNDWVGSGRLTARSYYDMLYSFDGMNIEHMPIKASYWTKELQSSYGQVQRLQKQDKEPLRGWTSRVSGRMRRTGGQEYEEDYIEEDYDY